MRLSVLQYTIGVVFSVLAFALERDWLYTVVSGIVLALLGYSLFW